MPKRKRFLILDDEGLAKKSAEQKNLNTKKSDDRADRAFRNFLQAMGREENDCDYWDFTPESLDDYLAKFWFGARKNVNETSDTDEETENEDPTESMYSANILRNYRYALGRIIKSKKPGTDIIAKENNIFPKSQAAFFNAMKELKKFGKGDIKNKAEIDETDRVKMYNHPYMSPDASPGSLQRKVQFDLRFYFFRRGMENIQDMKKDHFKLDYDTKTETWRVMKAKDELTKNHKETGSLITGIMPENKGDPLCPVSSYIKYHSHLNPENEYLWQTELRKVDMQTEVVWYSKGKIGKNPLAKFMSTVSEKCELSKIYTNHCIRVTGASILTRMKFSASEIMSVTGHKSVQSLTVYQKTDDKKKSEMGEILGQAMNKSDHDLQALRMKQILPQPPVPPPQPRPAIEYNQQPVVQAVQNKENATDAIVPFNHDDQQVPSFDLNQLINDVMADERNAGNQLVNSTNTSNVVNNVPKSMFSNCSIGNITFNFQK